MSDQATMVETVTLTIDGQEVTVPKGTTLLEAAEGIGTRVPHYCYHPGLSSPAQCRLCLVEVEGAPKLQPSCVTMAGEGQVVRTQSAPAKGARQGVLDFYLQNHPLDCPICDQSGECFFQDYVHAEGPARTTTKEPKRVFGRDDFGGDVLFYGDRCVMCTRCVRFMDEVAQDPRLTVVERGNRSVIDTFFEEGLGGSPWAGNVVDICPVGALVSKDFLHKARAWDLDRTPSICTSCSQGCNIELHVRDNLVQRLKPRDNPEVNGHWMCDFGRERYEGMNRGGRIAVPSVGKGAARVDAPWEEVLPALAQSLEEARGKEVRAVASPFASNEDLGMLRRLVEALGGGEIIFRVPRASEEIPLPGMPSLARRRELAPNVKGAELLGARSVGNEDATGGIEDLTSFDGILLVLGDALADAAPSFGGRAAVFVWLGTHAPPPEAHMTLPISTHAEGEGTFTNLEGRVQRFWPGLHAPGVARPAWEILGTLARRLEGGEGEAPTRAAEAFQALGALSPAFRGFRWEDLGTRGALVNDTVSLPGA